MHHVADPEPVGLLEIGRDVLAIVALVSLPPRLSERAAAEDFDVESVREGRHQRIADVIDAALSEFLDNGVDELRVDQRAIPGDANDDLGVDQRGGLMVAIEHVVFAALVQHISQVADELGQGFVARILRRGDHDLVDPAG